MKRPFYAPARAGRRCPGPLLIVAILLLCTVIPGSGYSIASAQGTGWGTSQRISPLGQFAWFPDVAVDVSGGLHVVWSSGSEGYDVVMYTSSTNGVDWSPANDIVALPQVGGAYATRPTLLIDPQGSLHMTFRNADIYHASTPVQLASSAAAWRSTTKITDQGYYSQMAQDSRGTLHIVFSREQSDASCTACSHMFYAHSTDNGLTWAGLTDLSSITGNGIKPQIVIDKKDNIYIAWEQDPAPDANPDGQEQAMFTASYDGGTTWTLSAELTGSGLRARNVALGLDGKDRLMAVFLRLPEDKIYYQVSVNQGQSWTAPQAIAGLWGAWTIYQGRFDDYSMARDSAGALHLICVGRTSADQQSLSLLHLRWSDSVWYSPEPLNSPAGYVPEWPRIAVGEGNKLHVVWFVRDQENLYNSDGGHYQVWYVEGKADAPAVARAPLPTFVPTPTVEAAAQAAAALATKTPVPGFSTEMSNEITDPRMQEIETLKILALTLAPTVMLIGAVILVTRLRRASR
jgi:hypothetical protein